MAGNHTFISYARESSVSKEHRDFLASELEAYDFDIWLDQQDIESGEDWLRRIQTGIDESAALIVIWSKEASSSKWVSREAHRADSKGKLVIPLLFDDTELDFYLQTTQAIDFRPSWNKGFAKLVARLSKHMASFEQSAIKQSTPWESKAYPYLRNRFLEDNSYLDSKHPNFAQNPRTNLLRSVYKDRPAAKWASFVTIPIPHELQNELVEHVRQLYFAHNRTPSGIGIDSAEAPWKYFDMTNLSKKYDQNTEFILYQPSYSSESEFAPSRYTRFSQGGAIEYAVNDYIALWGSGEHIAFFNYIYIIGLAWKFLMFAIKMYSDSGYRGDIQLLINLRETSDTYLGNFANVEGSQQEWNMDLRKERYTTSLLERYNMFKSRQTNLQFAFNLSVAQFLENPQLSRELIEDLSIKLCQSFNYSPQHRQYAPGTTTFPWDEFNFWANR